jgi:hypothetical protein
VLQNSQFFPCPFIFPASALASFVRQDAADLARKRSKESVAKVLAGLNEYVTVAEA